MPKDKVRVTTKETGVLHLTIQIEGSVKEILDFAVEVVEKAREQGSITGRLVLPTGEIAADDLS